MIGLVLVDLDTTVTVRETPPIGNFVTKFVRAIRMTFILGLVMLGVSCQPRGQQPQSAGTLQPVHLDLLDYRFDPSDLSLKTSEEAPRQVIAMSNKGLEIHNFSIDSLGLDLDVPPDDRTHHTPNFFSEKGRYEFFCKYHRERGMIGTIEVS